MLNFTINNFLYLYYPLPPNQVEKYKEIQAQCINFKPSIVISKSGMQGDTFEFDHNASLALKKALKVKKC